MESNSKQNSTKGIGIFALILLISGAIDSIRNLPATALAGETLVFYFFLAAIIFLIPVALISARLSSAFPTQGGIYLWVHQAFGPITAFLAVWLQWINTMVWFPTILSFIAGTAAWLINPALAQNKIYLVTIILIMFWAITLINLRGVQTSAKFASICAIVGLIIPMTLIIIFAVTWIIKGNQLQLHFTSNNIIPNFSGSSHWIALTAVITSFVGMELATVHIRDVRNPQKVFPKALLFSVALVLTTMIFGALSLAIVVPVKKISLVAGIMQAFTKFLDSFHLAKLTPALTIMLIIGSLGGMTSWLISPARGLLQAAEHHFLPSLFIKKNKFGVASRLLVTQAIAVTLICLIFLLMPSVNGSYWLLSDLSTELYLLMYALMFITGITLEKKIPNNNQKLFKLPGGNWGTYITCLIGLIGCAIAFCVGFIPPTEIDIGSARHYEIVFSTGLLIMIMPTILFISYRKRFLEKLENHPK